MSQPVSVLKDGMLGVWAARKNLGNELYGLSTHALYAQSMLHIASCMETENSSLHALLLQLQLLVHDADVVLNELDYFRIQDELDGTYRAVDVPPKGCFHCLHFHARHADTAVVATKLKPSSTSRDTAKFIEKLAFVDPSSECCVGNERQVQPVKTPKPKFNRVLLPTKITNIVEKLKPLCSMVKTLI